MDEQKAIVNAETVEIQQLQNDSSYYNFLIKFTVFKKKINIHTLYIPLVRDEETVGAKIYSKSTLCLPEFEISKMLNQIILFDSNL